MKRKIRTSLWFGSRPNGWVARIPSRKLLLGCASAGLLWILGGMLLAQPPRLRLGQRQDRPPQKVPVVVKQPSDQPSKGAQTSPVQLPSDPPITVATEEEKNQKIATDWQNPWLVLYITGNQTGYLEPCGCTGLSNQKGGINRKDTLLTSLKNRGWQIMALDAGDQVRRDGTQSEIKFNWTTQAFRQMGYAATTYGAKDLLLSDNILLSVLDENGTNNLFVSANVSMLPDQDLRYKVFTVQGADKKIRKIGVTGILGEESLKAHATLKQGFFTVSPTIPALKEVAAKLKEEKCDYQILLASANLEETKKIVEAVEGFQLVVTSGGYGEPTYRPEVLPGSTSEIVQVGTKGMYAGIVGLFDDPSQPTRYQRIALSSQFEDSPRMLELFSKYQDELRNKADDNFSALGLRPITHPTGRSYAGTQKCGECHTTAHEIWKNTPHASATDSIVKPPERSMARHFDPECISCHVTGWNPQKFFPYKTGYETLEGSPDLHGNGCENCHGPGLEHVQAEENSSGDSSADKKQLEELRNSMRLTLANAQEKCLECHDIDNSPEFHKEGAFEKFWEQVKHYGKD
ncbi:MAG: multiheme c-type cytochrome [Pirellula sp.]